MQKIETKFIYLHRLSKWKVLAKVQRERTKTKFRAKKSKINNQNR